MKRTTQILNSAVFVPKLKQNAFLESFQKCTRCNNTPKPHFN